MFSSAVKAIALAAAISLSATACVQNRTFGSGVDDIQSDASLKARLFKDERFDYGDVDITVYEGRVLLTGTMRTDEGKYHVGKAAERSANVVEVLNEIVVSDRTPFQQGARDALIDQRLSFALRADNGVYKGNYQIAVSNGTVYLLGLAQGPNELRRVTEHARNIKGVKSVVSHVIYVGDPRRETRDPVPLTAQPAQQQPAQEPAPLQY
jgi:osmotically-inducible protein OsmY